MTEKEEPGPAKGTGEDACVPTTHPTSPKSPPVARFVRSSQMFFRATLPSKFLITNGKIQRDRFVADIALEGNKIILTVRPSAKVEQ